MKDQEKQKALDEREEAAIESQKEEKRPGCYCKRPCIPLKHPKCSWCCCPGGVTGATGPTGPSGATGAFYLGKATICKNAASFQTASLWVLTSINS